MRVERPPTGLLSSGRTLTLVDFPLPDSPTTIMPWRTSWVSCTWITLVMKVGTRWRFRESNTWGEGREGGWVARKVG